MSAPDPAILRIIDPELAPLVPLMPTRPVTAATLEQERAALARLTAGYQRPSGDGIARSERFVPGPADEPDVRVVIYEPEGRSAVLPVVLFIHGGGFYGGSADMAEDWNRAQVRELGCMVVSVDYRLAPETRFPGPQEDCYAVLLWLVREAAALDIDPARIAVEGVSAGGALAASLCLMARDRGEAALAFQALVYPMLDDRTARAPRDQHTGQLGWFHESNAFGWGALLGEDRVAAADVPAYAAPARAADLAGLPPAYIGAAALDMLVYEDVAYAARLIAAGVPTSLVVYPRAFHGFNFGDAGVTRRFKHDRMEALRRGLGIA